MNTLAIDINDAKLIVADDSGILAMEPGYALVAAGVVQTGDEAYAQARVKPRESSNRYWEKLSLEEGSAGIDGVANSAQLAFAQLQDLWKRYGGAGKEALLVVPDYYNREQLGLLLGLAQECEMPVRSLLNAAVAASPRPYPGQRMVYLDAGLHRVSATVLKQGDDVAVRTEKAIDGVGLASLMDLWAKRVAEIFVLSTRFDPFHVATTEQLVYDRLPEWLRILDEEDSAELQLPHGDKDFSVEVERNQLLGVASGFYRALVQLLAQCRTTGDSLVVQVSHRLLGLPGVLNELSRLDDAHIQPLRVGEAALGALEGLAGLPAGDGQVKLLKRLPWREEGAAVPVAEATAGTAEESAPEPVAQEPAPKSDSIATHIVYRGVAIPVDAGGIVIGRESFDDRRTIVLNGDHGGVSRSHCELIKRDGELFLTDLSQYGTFINEKRVNGDQAVAPADVIRIGSPGEELQAIAVEESDGA
ncbi:MAG: FHA domain-containing protein [Candidatus Rariloculaceae bacterium]